MKASSKRRPEARRIGRIMALAFFEEEATAMGQPLATSARIRRNASGKAAMTPVSIKTSSRACLGRRIGGGAPGAVWRPKGFQRGAGAGKARLSRHLRLVDRRGEAGGVGETCKRLTPGLLMGRRHHNAVDVENAVRRRASARADGAPL